MTRAQLEHAIRAACNVVGCESVVVFGSQSILGSFPDAPPELRTSMEVDIDCPEPPGGSDLIDGAIGEASRFQQTFGFYVHGVSIEAAVLAPGWRDRLVRIVDPASRAVGLCLDPHDLAASKLAAFREKDLEFVTVLLAESMIDPTRLLEHIEALPLDPQDRDRLERWVTLTIADL